MAAGFTHVLFSPLPPPLRRAIHGYLGRRAILVDELPPHRRPAVLAMVEDLTAGEPLGPELTILSYNVKRAERMGEVTESLLEATFDHHPQLILLQEAPPALIRHDRLASVLGTRSLLYAPFHQVDRFDRRYPHSQYGQLIASTCPMVNHRVLELPTVNQTTLGPGHLMKRIALYAELTTTEGRTVGVVNVHNEPFARRRDRCLQHQWFLNAVNQRSPEIAVCCGDFNPTFSQRGEPGIRLLQENGFSNAFAHRWRALDTCLARGHTRFLGATPLPLGGSDHRPIVVRVQL